MKATVMFNGSLYEGEILRETAKRMLVRFTTGTDRTRETWFSKTEKPIGVGVLVGRRDPRAYRDGYPAAGFVTIPANSGFAHE